MSVVIINCVDLGVISKTVEIDVNTEHFQKRKTEQACKLLLNTKGNLEFSKVNVEILHPVTDRTPTKRSSKFQWNSLRDFKD